MNPITDSIQVNTHSSVRLQGAGKVVYIDPFRLEETPRDADVIFVTHSHFDHFSPEDIAKVGKADTVFVMPAGMEQTAAPAVAGRRVIPVVPGQRGSVAGLEFETVPAYNLKKRFHPREEGWVGYVLTLEGCRIYIAGDTDATPEAAAVCCDAALLPIGGKYTMDAAEAAALANRMKPGLVIPIHYGSVAGSPKDYERFVKALDREIRVRRLI